MKIQDFSFLVAELGTEAPWSHSLAATSVGHSEQGDKRIERTRTLGLARLNQNSLFTISQPHERQIKFSCECPYLLADVASSPRVQSGRCAV